MSFCRIKPKQAVYLTRDTEPYPVRIDIFPATVGIRKFHGCIAWGAAWNSDYRSFYTTSKEKREIPDVTFDECRKKYGFLPRSGTAWLITYTPSGRQRKPVKIDIDFSN